MLLTKTSQKTKLNFFIYILLLLIVLVKYTGAFAGTYLKPYYTPKGITWEETFENSHKIIILAMVLTLFYYFIIGYLLKKR